MGDAYEAMEAMGGKPSTSEVIRKALEGASNEARRQKALEQAVKLGCSWKNSAPSAEVVVTIADVFETYLKEGK